MALVPLATEADLSARGVDTSNTTLVAAMLAEASAVVREAAGSPISEVASTVSLLAPEGLWLRLPGGPVTAVSAVSVDGDAVTDWTLAEGALYRSSGWRGSRVDPSLVEVTFTHGYATVPDDVVGLVAALAAAGVNAAASGGFGSKVGVQSEQEAYDDYSRSTTYVTGDEATAGVMELPSRTVAWLRQRFGGGAHVTGWR